MTFPSMASRDQEVAFSRDFPLTNHPVMLCDFLFVVATSGEGWVSDSGGGDFFSSIAIRLRGLCLWFCNPRNGERAFAELDDWRIFARCLVLAAVVGGGSRSVLACVFVPP